MKILIVDPDATRGPSLKRALAADGAEVTVARSGSFALTMLERNRHDVVLGHARIDDMDGHELCAILKSDPSTRDVRFVLVAGAEEASAAQTTPAGVDLLLPPTMPAAAMLPLISQLVQGEAPPAGPPPATTPAPAPAMAPAIPPSLAPVLERAAAPASAVAPAPTAEPSPAAPPARAPEPLVPTLRPDPVTTPVPEPPKRYVTAAAAAAAAPWSASAPAPAAPAAIPAPAPPAVAVPTAARPPAAAAAPVPAAAGAATLDLASVPSGTFQGSLEVMDLANLTQAIAMGGKTGRLILATPQGGGLIVFNTGHVVHAEYRGAVGEPAFAALVSASQSSGAGRFCFLPSKAGEKTAVTRTITKSVDRLLLSIATAVDEKG